MAEIVDMTPRNLTKNQPVIEANRLLILGVDLEGQFPVRASASAMSFRPMPRLQTH